MPGFDLHLMGWHAFQQLCHTITGEVLGQTVEAYLTVADGARDGAFTGTWREDDDAITGRFVIQCKHTSRPATTLAESDVEDDLRKAARLTGEGRCDAYVLMTNAGLTGTTVETIEDRLRVAGIRHFRCLQQPWIERVLTENKRLRMLVPRV